ncbi:MAG: divalent-cation tolerance protein CutA [Arcobacter sp.]|nr:MAG: divalent-cation tolerance protein CutA [Arcobacter sp.]
MYIIIQTTTKNKKEAKKLTKLLITKKLAACIQISKINSFYTWENKLCVDKERLLSIKTKQEHYEEIEILIKENHSYETPEIISYELNNLSKAYALFINENTQ